MAIGEILVHGLDVFTHIQETASKINSNEKSAELVVEITNDDIRTIMAGINIDGEQGIEALKQMAAYGVLIYIKAINSTKEKKKLLLGDLEIVTQDKKHTKSEVESFRRKVFGDMEVEGISRLINMEDAEVGDMLFSISDVNLFNMSEEMYIAIKEYISNRDWN